MKKTYGLMLGVLVLLPTLAAMAQDQTPVIDKREKRQQKRIEQGVKSGELTPNETKRLEKREARIKNEENRDKAKGYVTPQERRQLRRQENRTSRAIYRKKHNDVKADSGGH